MSEKAQDRVVGEREERLREALLIALANNPLCDDLPDDLADATHLYDAGLLQLHRDFSDEYYTSITDAGQEFILAALASSPSPPDREQTLWPFLCLKCGGIVWGNRRRWFVTRRCQLHQEWE